MSLNRAELVLLVQKNLGKEVSKAESERVLAAVLDAFRSGIKKGGVQLIGFGSFKVVQRKARTGINPKTRQKLKIKASKTVKFTPSKDLKKSL